MLRNIDTSELDAKIARYASAYQHAKQAFTNHITKHIWGKTNKESIEISKKVIQKIWDEGEKIKEELIQLQIYDNVFFTVRIKLQVLVSRIYIATNDLDSGIKEINNIIKQLPMLQKHKAYNISNDLQFQHEVSFIFRALVQFLKQEGKSFSEKIYFANAAAVELMKDWPPSIYKLQAIHNYWFSTRPGGTTLMYEIKPEDRNDYVRVLNATLNHIKDELAKNPTDATLSIDFARANMLAYAFYSATSPLSVWRYDAKKPITVFWENNQTEILRLLKFTHESFMKYIDSSLKQLLKADPSSLKENADPVSDIVPLILEYRKATNEIFNIHKQCRTMKPQENITRYLTLAGLDMIDVITDSEEISHTFQLNNSRAIVKICGKLSSEPEAIKCQRQAASEARQQLFDGEKRLLAAKALNADQAALFLIAWDEKEKQRMASLEAHFQKKQSKKPEASPNISIEKSLHCFSRAQYFSRNLRHREAIDMYKIAYQDATKENDHLVRLAALDGHLFTLGKTLSKKTKILKTTLSTTLRSIDIIPEEQQEYLKQLTQEVENEYQQLTKLHASYTALSQHPDTLINPNISTHLSLSNELMSTLLHEIRVAIDKTDDLYQQLCENLKKRHDNAAYRAGYDAVKHMKDKKFSIDELKKIGEDIFKMKGRQKRLAGIELRGYGTQIKTVELLAKKFASIRANLTKLTTDSIDFSVYKLLTPEMHQIENELKPLGGEFAFVGSCVISAVSNIKKLKPIKIHDIDVISTCSNPIILITAGYTPSPYNPYLHQKFSPLKADVMLAKSCSPNWVTEDAETRDFTICAVYIKNNMLCDPTGMGIDDIINNRLRMIGNPIQRLHEDPVRALRAIRFMLDGFNPDGPLKKALKEIWIPDEKHRQHLYAVTRKHLQSHLDRKQYLNMLHEYGLLKKFFNITLDKNPDRTLRQLEDLVGIKLSVSNNKNVLYSRTDDAVSHKKDKDNRNHMVSALNLA